MKVWSAFAGSRTIRIVCFALAAALLVTSAVGLGLSAAAPTGEVPAANYEHKGRFDYTVYVKPSVLHGDIVLPQEEEDEDAPMIFFRNIIDEVQLTFSHSFDSNQPLTGVTNRVAVSVVAENPGVWQKEIVQLDETYTGSEFSVDFPLSLASLESVVSDIEAEIGISATQRSFIVRAQVSTSAETALNRTIEEEFIYELPAILTARTLELEGDLEHSEDGYREGTRYEAKGRFDYEVSLRPSKLYETDVLRSETLSVAEPAAPAQTLGPGLVYFPKIVEDIEGRFSYQLLCDELVTEQSQEVEISATIENPGKWSRTLVLVPRTGKASAFVVSFPVDIQYFTMVIDAIGEETGARGTSHNIALTADVHTVALTEAGTIDEVYTQTLGATLEANSLIFDEELSRSQPGTVGGTATPGASTEGRSQAPWIIGLVVGLLALGYFGWSQTRLGLPAVSTGEAEVARARKRYKQMMLDVKALPEAGPGDTVVPLNSVDDVARVADDLAKSMLHQAEERRHSYCVIDSGVRYLYVVET